MTSIRNMTARPAALFPALIFGIGLLGAPAGEVRTAEWPVSAYVLQVDGLACPYCGYGIEKQFSGQEGVQGTTINIEQGVVVVSVAPGTRFPDSELRQLIHDAGFSLGRIVQRPAAE